MFATYIVVRAGQRERREVEAYLYLHSTIVATLNEGAGDVHIVHVMSFGDNSRDLADYQADRLGSGWITTHVCDTAEEAVQVARDTLADLMAKAEAGL